MTEPFTPFEPHHDRPQLGGGDALARTSFEWWYFDLQSEDGVSLVLIFSRRNPVLCARGASIYIEYSDRTGAGLRRVCNYPPTSFSVTDIDGGFEIRVDRHTLRILGNTATELVYQLHVEIPDMSIELEMRPEHRGFLPTSDGCYFRQRRNASRRTCVSFSAPLMRATGSIRYRRTSRSISGRGYHDHPWGTEQLFATHHRWNWGRMSNATTGEMFARVVPRPDYAGILCFHYSAQFGTFEPVITSNIDIDAADWRRDSIFGIRFPHRLGITSAGRRETLQCEQSLLDTPVYDRTRVKWLPGGGAPAGKGWVEYYDLPGWLTGAAFLGSRIAAFFWRPFPWFGR